MKSKIAEKLKLRYSPVAVYYSDDKPDGTIEIAEDKWVCVVSLLSAAAKGKTAAVSRKKFGCRGAIVGLGLEKGKDTYRPGFEHFLSTGGGDFGDGERYIKTPELAKKFMDELPQYKTECEYVVMRPIDTLAPGIIPEIVVFLANADQISALTVLANYSREGTDNVIVPMSSGCSQFMLHPYHSEQSGDAKAVLGMTDVTARKYIDADLLTFSIPYEMLMGMENDIEGSFLDMPDWAEIRKRIK